MFNSDGDRFPPCRTWQQRILKAAGYAAFAQEHPVYRLKTAGTQVSAYSLAFVDSLGKPRLVDMDISRWTGGIGQRIHIQVMDNVEVLQVRVMIPEHRMSDTVLESGHAHPSRLDPRIWTYLTKTQIHQAPGFCVDVIAIDLPGNVGVDTVEFDLT
jgi:hypothetical protein